MNFNKIRELTLEVQEKSAKFKNFPIIKTKFQGQNVEFYKLKEKYSSYLEPEVSNSIRQSLLRSQKSFRVLSPVIKGKKISQKLKQGPVKKINLGVKIDAKKHLKRLDDGSYLISGRKVISNHSSPRPIS